MALKLDKDQLQEGIVAIKKAANQDIIEDIKSLGAIFANEAENNLKEQTIEVCKSFEKAYNETFVPSIEELVALFGEHIGYAEEIEKAIADSLSSTDASFSTKGLQGGRVSL